MKLAWCGALLLWANAAYAQSPASAHYRIAGIVVKPDGREPARGMRVTLSSGADPTQQRHAGYVETGQDGRFAFDGMAAGKYLLQAGRPGAHSQYFGQTSLLNGTAVGGVVGPDQQTDNLVFRLIAPSAISGRVVGPEGEPAAGVFVQLLRTNVQAGRRLVTTANGVYTNDQGEYRFGGLPPGEYYLAATGVPWYAEQMAAELGTGERPESFVPMFYPNVRDARAAAPLRLAEGQEARADFNLMVARGVSLTLSVHGPKSGRARVFLTIDGPGGAESMVRQSYVTVAEAYQPHDAETSIGGLLPGRYKIGALAGEENPLYAERVLDIGSADVKVDLTVAGLPAMSGVVHMEDGSAVPEGTLIVFRSAENGLAGAREVEKDGKFQFVAALPGMFEVALTGPLSTRVHLRSIAMNGTSTGGAIRLGTQPLNLEIVASRENGGISGFVYCGGKPCAGAMVVLAPKERAISFDHQFYLTDSDGSFDFPSTAPAEYAIFALEQWEPLEYANPEVMRPHLAGARSVRVQNGKSETVRLDLERK